MSEKEQFLYAWENEFKTTLKVFKAYPEHRQDFKPHEIARSAKELAWTIVSEEKAAIEGVIAGEISFNFSPAPATMAELISHYEKSHHEMVELVKSTSDEKLHGTIKFFAGPKTMVDMGKFQVLWSIVLMDAIHHRGQFSVYLRMTGGKVPSIYGPSADEPWN